MNYEIRMVEIAKLIPAPYNSRKHPDRAVERLTTSIERFGFTNPILAQKGTNTVTAGHARLKGAIKAGLTEVPVHFVDFDDDEAMAYNIADNSLAELTEWDLPALTDLITRLDTGAINIELTGFDANELKELIDYDAYHQNERDDPIPETPEEPITREGDLLTLGQHRLLCGDSTKAEDVDRLMAGSLADLVFTDPPYGVDYEGWGGKHGPKDRRGQPALGRVPGISGGDVRELQAAHEEKHAPVRFPRQPDPGAIRKGHGGEWIRDTGPADMEQARGGPEVGKLPVEA